MGNVHYLKTINKVVIISYISNVKLLVSSASQNRMKHQFQHTILEFKNRLIYTPKSTNYGQWKKRKTDAKN